PMTTPAVAAVLFGRAPTHVSIPILVFPPLARTAHRANRSAPFQSRGWGEQPMTLRCQRDQPACTRQHPSTWSSTIPDDCISAYIVVGPTKRKPRPRSVLLRAVDSSVTAGTSPSSRG